MKPYKVFKVASIGSNPDAAGRYGHIVVAADGESWEVARVGSGNCPAPWHVGDFIEVAVVTDPIKESSHFDWEQIQCVVPRQLSDAPLKVVALLWGDSTSTVSDVDRVVREWMVCNDVLERAKTTAHKLRKLLKKHGLPGDSKQGE